MLRLPLFAKQDISSLKNNMLKKLRIKFIAMTMVMIAVVLALVFSTVCFVTYKQSLYTTFNALNQSVSKSSIDESNESDNYTGLDSNQNQEDGTGTNSDNTNNNSSPSYNVPNSIAPEIGGLQGKLNKVIPIAVYKLESNSHFNLITALTTATVSESILYSQAEKIFNLSDGNGCLHDCGLYYAKNSFGGASYVAFADVSATSSWKTLARILLIFGAGTLVLFFIISLFFSRWALRPVQTAWTKQRQFIADASHDLKTPLTVIQANTEILLSNPEETVQSQEQWIESTQLEALQMQQLVKDLLFLARMDELPTPSQKNPVPISQIVETESLQFEIIAFEQGVQLNTDIEPNLTVLGEEAKIHRLVTILLDNACKYAPSGNEVDVKLTKTDSGIQLTVHNTGSYIKQQDLEHVFDRFYRLDSSRTNSQNSHGLGLAIAKAIIEEQGGSIKAISSEENGTTFTVIFS